MDFEILIPITFFLCITYAIKVVLDSRMRSKLLATNGSEEMIRSLVQNEELQSRYNSLRWGIVLISVAVGFGLIEWFGWDDLTPGAIAVLLGATGAGNLAFYSIARQTPR
jgi:hypothetical protein